MHGLGLLSHNHSSPRQPNPTPTNRPRATPAVRRAHGRRSERRQRAGDPGGADLPVGGHGHDAGALLAQAQGKCVEVEGGDRASGMQGISKIASARIFGRLNCEGAVALVKSSRPAAAVVRASTAAAQPPPTHNPRSHTTTHTITPAPTEAAGVPRGQRATGARVAGAQAVQVQEREGVDALLAAQH